MKTIERVRLSQIKPNESNPRADFGDIAALADSIRSTGGEPVNPIVCVRDGGVLFIVDGERRYRALKEINGDDDPEISVTVVDGWREGNEVLAMLATDNKKQLRADEMSRGYQLAFDLGTDYVDDTQLAMATGRKTDEVASARLVWGRLGREERERYSQCSLEQFAAAQEFEGKDRESILKAKPESWHMRAQNLRAKRETAKLNEKVADICAMAGIEWIDDRKREMPADLERCRTYWSMSDKLDGLQGDIEELGATAMVYDGMGWTLFRPATEDKTAEEEERRKRQEEADRASACAKSLRERLLSFMVRADRLANLSKRCAENRNSYVVRSLKEALVGAGMDPNAAERVVTSPAGPFELMDWARNLSVGRWGKPSWAPGVLKAAEADGFEPDEDDRWLSAYIEREEADAR